MARRALHAGITSVALPIAARDTSSTTGGGLSGLVYNTAGLVAEYRRQGSSSWISLSLVAGTLGTYVSGGLVADGALPGRYELGIPDAALASGARWVVVRLYGAANMLPYEVEIELLAVDPQDAAAFGLSRLDISVGSRSTYAGGAVASVTGAVGSVTSPVTVGGYSAGEDPAALLLAVPANKLATDTAGRVAVGSSADKTGYALSGAGVQAIWDALTSALTAPGSIGKRLVDFVTTLVYAAAPTALQIDTQLSSTHGSGSWGPSGTGLYTWTVNVTDGGNPVSPATVTIQDQNGGVLRHGTAGSGSIAFDLDAGTYRVLVGAGPGYAPLPGGYQSITVTANGSSTLTLTPQPIAPPSSPSGCVLYGYEAVGATPVVGRKVYITLVGKPVAAGGYIQDDAADPNTAELTTGSDGKWQFVDGVQGLTYQVRIPQAGIDRRVTLPAAASVDMATLLPLV